MKHTTQREEIIAFLKDNKTHPSALEIYDAIKQKLPYISKATVYQNLKLLAKKNIVRELDIKGIKRYETQMYPHQHMICKVCNKIIDFDLKKLDNYSKKISKEIMDKNEFEIDYADITFYGTCKECKKIIKK